MPSAETLDTNGRFAALFIGKSGGGKTGAACSFLDPAPLSKTRVLDLDFDGRIRGILGCPWLDKSRITYKYFPPMRAEKPTFNALNEVCEEIEGHVKQGQVIYETVVLDSITGMCNNFICDAIPLAHSRTDGKGKGRKLGTINLPGMEEYGYESVGSDQVLSFFRSIPIKNFIVTAHIIDKFGKSDPDDPYSPVEVVGTDLALRNKIAARAPVYFDHIFQFNKKLVNGKHRFYVEFRGELARTTFAQLPDSAEITGINFYEWMQKQLGNWQGGISDVHG